MGKEKKITRGIDKDFAVAFKNSELYTFYEKHKDELFIGIRNKYLNLYYNCDSVSKIKYRKKEREIVCEIAGYYLGDDKNREKLYKVKPKEICEKYTEIKKRSDEKKALEKESQSKLVLFNNNNEESNWFCVDIEYVKQFHTQEEKLKAGFNARFDIVALSKQTPHRVALIELKYGSGAIGGGSGIYKHVGDFKKFKDEGFFENHMKQEIIDIVKSQIELGLSIPFELPFYDNVLAPEFYFVTLNNNAEKANGSTPMQTMAGYLFNDKRWGTKRLSTRRIESEFGDITSIANDFYATFLFSKKTVENLNIKDIIDGNYDKKIYPE